MDFDVGRGSWKEWLDLKEMLQETSSATRTREQGLVWKKLSHTGSQARFQKSNIHSLSVHHFVDVKNTLLSNPGFEGKRVAKTSENKQKERYRIGALAQACCIHKDIAY